MKRQSGFTLIELVVVIVILGILAVTAAPRFLDLQGEARESTLQGMVGAMQGAASVVYAKAAMENKEKDDADDASSVDSIDIVYGYPAATDDGIVTAVTGLSATDTTQWTGVANTTDGTYVVTLTSMLTDAADTVDKIENANCYVEYTPASTSGDAASAVLVDNDDTDDGC